MQKGAAVHRKLQKERKKGSQTYECERKVSVSWECEGFEYEITGLIDGVEFDGDASVIDEFKTTSKGKDELEWDTYPAYSAQIMMYGCMYCLENSLNFVTLRLSFYNYDGDETVTFEKEFTFTALYEWFTDTLNSFTKWIKLYHDHRIRRDKSIKQLAFPFGVYRKGQRELCAKVYRCIRDKKRLYAQAPTGTGKTVSTLFPAVKALGEGYGEKIFYLSAKTVGSIAASDCVNLLCQNGLEAKYISLNAKERICPFDKNCMPSECEYSEGHFDRINGALFELVSNCDGIDMEKVLEISKKHRVCPFELQLDASWFCDIIIGDYNYFFDPKAHLLRYFSDTGDYIVLADEAHNLAERAREMFSQRLSLQFVLSFYKYFKGKRRLKNLLKKCIDVLEEYRIRLNSSEKSELCTRIEPSEIQCFSDFCEAYAAFLADGEQNDIKKQTLELYFELSFFVEVYLLEESLPDFFTEYISKAETDCVYNIICTDPSELINQSCAKIRSCIFFSATLSPFEYYLKMLGKGGLENDEIISVPSPFPPENQLCCIVKNVSTRFKDRDTSRQEVCRIIHASVCVSEGNYMAFFPSYSYMQSCYELFCDMYPEIFCIIQSPNMTKEQKEEFLDSFNPNPDKIMVAFALCSGVFSEGVDLVGERLKGAVIIGTGMPGVSFERNLLKSHFDKTLGEGRGFNFAYTYTGLNHVFQAGGRVIRTATDHGFVVLADDRYMKISHRGNFPEQWKNYKIVDNCDSLTCIVKDFLNKK